MCEEVVVVCVYEYGCVGCGFVVDVVDCIGVDLWMVV